MADAKHTPGPWKMWPANGQDDASGRPMVTDEPGEVGIAHVIQRMREPDTLYPKEAEANCRLIAAAPELLEALERALPLVQLLGAKMNNPKQVADTTEAIFAALAKAKGESV